MSEQQDHLQATPEQKPRSGYGRLRGRHRALIAEHEALSKDYFTLLDKQEALQRDVDNLLAQHERLMKAAKAPPPATNWFESANRTLAQLAANPDPRAVQVFVAALAALQTRVGPIVMRTPL